MKISFVLVILISIELLNLLDSFSLTQIVNRPTRLADAASAFSLIDLIVTSIVNITTNVQVDSLHGLTDHELIRCGVSSKKAKAKPRIVKYQSFKQFEYADFDSHLRSLPVRNIYVWRMWWHI